MLETIRLARYQAHHVVTTRQLAALLGCGEYMIRQSYARHKARFKDGQHCFRLGHDEVRSFAATLPQDTTLVPSARLMLWTLRGVALHAKVSGTDQSWQVMESLAGAWEKGVAA